MMTKSNVTNKNRQFQKPLLKKKISDDIGFDYSNDLDLK
jgi:hypothetical protein